MGVFRSVSNFCEGLSIDRETLFSQNVLYREVFRSWCSTLKLEEGDIFGLFEESHGEIGQVHPDFNWGLYDYNYVYNDGEHMQFSAQHFLTDLISLPSNSWKFQSQPFFDWNAGALYPDDLGPKFYRVVTSPRDTLKESILLSQQILGSHLKKTRGGIEDLSIVMENYVLNRLGMKMINEGMVSTGGPYIDFRGFYLGLPKEYAHFEKE